MPPRKLKEKRKAPTPKTPTVKEVPQESAAVRYQGRRDRSRALGIQYSRGLSDRNRLAGGSQLISKFLREIEPTVSQFLNVHAFRK